MNKLKDKIAVVTGSGAGIGRALAIGFAEEGCHMAISDINIEDLKETERLIKEKGVNVYSQVLDVSDKKAMSEYPGRVIEKLGGVDIVVNNAGVCEMATIEEHSIEDYEWLMGINFWGVLYGSKFFIPYLKKESPACIVNISSVFGIFPMSHLSSYCTSKFAVRGFTETLRHELRKTNIRVMTAFPGGVKTNFAEKGRFKSVPGEKSHEEFNAIFQKFSFSTVDKTAKKIIRGIKKKKARVLIGPDAFLGDFFLRLMPIRYDLFVRFVNWIM